MSGKRKLSGSGVSRRDLIRLGAGGLGFGLFGGIGPVPHVFGQSSELAAQVPSGGLAVRRICRLADLPSGGFAVRRICRPGPAGAVARGAGAGLAA